MQSFNIVLSRAVAGLPLLWQLSNTLLEKQGFLMAMKGTMPISEIEILKSKNLHVSTIATTSIFNIGERHLIKVAY